MVDAPLALPRVLGADFLVGHALQVPKIQYLRATHTPLPAYAFSIVATVSCGMCACITV
jgi:hypothetical protein